MQVKNYSKKDHGSQLCELFLAIHPKNICRTERMVNIEENPDHVTTKVAIVGSEVIAQANIVYLIESKGIANLGCNVHPDYQRKGIGTYLSKQVMEAAIERGVKVFVARMERSSDGSRKLAEKLGFLSPPDDFLEKYRYAIPSKNIQDLLVLYKPVEMS